MGRRFETLYHEEAYLFDVVGPAFRRTGRLRAYDFFFIVRWKANRAIRTVARRLLKAGGSDLQSAVARLGRDVIAAKDSAQRLRVLTEKWGLRLPMASAILTVFYPKEFTVYDYRVATQLGSFRHLAARRGRDCGLAMFSSCGLLTEQSRWRFHSGTRTAFSGRARGTMTLSKA